MKRRFRRYPSRLALPIPLPDGLRAAQISQLPEFCSVEPFSRQRWSELEAFAPGVLVGYAYDLERIATEVSFERLLLTTVDRAIYVLTDCGSYLVKDDLRERLWRVFGVPVFELLIAPGCSLLAAECKAHAGWHLQDNIEASVINGEIVCTAPNLATWPTGFAGQIASAVCGCGRQTARLLDLQPFARRSSLQAA